MKDKVRVKRNIARENKIKSKVVVENVSYARHCPLKNRKHLTSKLFYIPTLDLFRNVYSSAGGSHVTAPTPVLQQQRYRLSGSVLLAGIPNTISPVELY